MIFWKIVSGIGAISFITTGFSILFDSNCKSVDFSGGRAVLATCRPDDYGTFPGLIAGIAMIIGGFVLIYLFIPEVGRFLTSLNRQADLTLKPNVKAAPAKYVPSSIASGTNFEIKICLGCKERVPLNYEKCFNCQGTNLQIRLANLENFSEAVSGVEAPEFKNCPECAEEVKFAARKCKHCGSQI